MIRAYCIGCSCHDLHACVDPTTTLTCAWLAVDYKAGVGVCSSCPGAVARWRKGDRKVTFQFTRGQQEAALDQLKSSCEYQARRRATESRRAAAMQPYAAAKAFLESGCSKLLLKCSYEVRSFVLAEVLRDEALASELFGVTLEQHCRRPNVVVKHATTC